jgi:spermidine synthase
MNERLNGSRFWLALPSLFFLSYAVLTFEVALTRIFSVMLDYHYVFAILSAALLGLGLGAMLLKRWHTVLPPSAGRMSAVLFALLVAASVWAIISVPIADKAGFWLYLALAVLPFCAAGFAISGLFQEFAERGPLLYGADLIGAAIGALTVVPLLNIFGGVNAVFFAAAVASVGALLLGFSRVRRPVFAGAAFLAISLSFALLAGFRVQMPVPIVNYPDKDMYEMLANPAFKAKIVESRWSSFGRTDVVQTERLPNELTLFVDGAAGSTMYNSAAVLKDPHEMEHLTLHYGEYFPFLFLKDDQKKNALIIGPGGGRDVVVALIGGVKSITAVEVNPDVVQIVKDYGYYNGKIYSGDPRVNVVVAEGRNFVRKSDAKYDLIMLALPITKSLRGVGFELTENYLFTVEAFNDYLDHLSPGGRIIIVAHGDPEIYRNISLAIEAFRLRGVPEQEAMKHLYTVASDMMPAIVIQNQALAVEEADQIHKGLHSLGFDKGSFYVPYQQQVVTAGARLGVDKDLRMFDQFLIDVADGKVSMPTLARSARLDVGVVTDNRPFFYKFDRGLPPPFGVFSFLLVIGLVTLLYLVFLPKKAGTTPVTFTGALRERPTLKLFLLLFSTLGVGYMLIEIALFQKLMLFIGQPQMALTVLLFSLLLGGGLGSFVSAFLRGNGARAVAFISMGVALAVVLLSFFFPSLFSLGFSPRVTATAMLIPLGFIMGFPFPLAIRLTDGHGLASNVSVMWGVNGIASVLGSALSMIIGISVGFSWALALGAALYMLAAVIFLALPAAPKEKRT